MVKPLHRQLSTLMPTKYMAKHNRSSSEVTLQKRKPRRTHAVERNEARRLANVRLIRTMILGTIATGAALYWLGDQYGIEPEVIKAYLLSAFVFVAGLAGLGLPVAVAVCVCVSCCVVSLCFQNVHVASA